MNVLSGIAGRVRHASIASKLGAGFALVLLLGSFIAVSGVYHLTSINERAEKASLLKTVNDLLSDAKFTRLSYMASKDPRFVEENRQALDKLEARQADVEAYSWDPQDQRLVETMPENIRRYRESWQHTLNPPAGSDAEKITAQLAEAGLALTSASNTLLNHEMNNLHNEVTRTISEMLVIIVATVVAGVLISWRMTRQLTLPLRRTLQTAERIAAGQYFYSCHQPQF